jgi:alanyl-tRNA synthetase
MIGGMTAKQIIDLYISFFERNGHKRIPNAPLVPENDPTTLFTSSGMQPLVPYLLGEQHSSGKRLVDVQNCFRAQDIEEVGDNRHTTFFRMLGNWSLGDYFKKEQLPWFFEFLTKKLNLDPTKLYVTVFEGNQDVPKDTKSIEIWTELFKSVGLDPKERIFEYGVGKNWWSRSGTPDKMPAGEPGGPDSEVFYDFGTPHNPEFGETCHVNCDCGRFLEIGNSVFMQYKKTENGIFELLPQQNVDFGGGLERLLAAAEHKSDVFETSLFAPIIKTLEETSGTSYKDHARAMRIIADHFIAATFITAAGVKPTNKEQGYILRRLIRRGIDHAHSLKNFKIELLLESIVNQYKDTDSTLVQKYEEIKNVILEEKQKYENVLNEAIKRLNKQYKIQSPGVEYKGIKQGDELLGLTEISADDAFNIYTSFGLSPTQIESLGYTFDKQVFAQKMEAHQKLSRTASAGKFKGGLADTQELTVKGHTATHLLQQALRDVLGNHVFQTGSNITTQRLRFDFSHSNKLTDEQIKKVEHMVREKIKADLPVHFEMLPVKEAKEIGAIGLFDEKYQENVKVYFIGGSGKQGDHNAYSKEFCGGPHVEHTGIIKSFTITKQEKLGTNQQRVYAVVQ